jgi:PAS domain S-box-containing protein
MSDDSPRPPRHTPSASRIAPIAEWREELDEFRSRVSKLGREAAQLREHSNDEPALRELAVTFEELSVAEEELRAQNAQLELAQERVERERSRYYALFHRAPVAYVVTDANGIISKANLAASALFGVRSERLAGKPLAVFIHEESKRSLRTIVSTIAAGEFETVTVPLSVAPRHGELVRVEATIDVGSHIEGDEREIRWLLIDQTQRLRREESDRERAVELEARVAERTAELERAQELKDELIATVSHEFRTALSAIGGYADLLIMGLRGPMTDVQLGDVDRIQHAYHHLATLVDDLLSYNKLASGRLVLQVDNVSLADTVGSMADLVAPLAHARNISLDIARPDDAIVIRADPERVRQIVLNLLGNAVKFTQVGGRIVLRCKISEDAAMVEVIDDGAGIPAEKLDAIFEPFVRLNAEIDTPGSGLGLAISRKLARAMNGELTVVSELGVGTRFTLSLPLSTGLAIGCPPS